MEIEKNRHIRAKNVMLANVPKAKNTRKTKKHDEEVITKPFINTLKIEDVIAYESVSVSKKEKKKRTNKGLNRSSTRSREYNTTDTQSSPQTGKIQRRRKED